MNIDKDSVAIIEYVLKIENTVVDESDGEPFAYLHGHGNIIPGLEKALLGLKAGDTFDVQISPEDGYGLYDEDLVDTLSRADFEDDIEVGGTYIGQTEYGEEVPFTVIDLQDDSVTVDYNHALAGEQLHFTGTVKEVRAATEEELAVGQALQ